MLSVPILCSSRIPDDGMSGPKIVEIGIIKAIVTVTPIFLFVIYYSVSLNFLKIILRTLFLNSPNNILLLIREGFLPIRNDR
jgi:hypothetical protein